MSKPSFSGRGLRPIPKPRTVRGFPITLHDGRQGKHIETHQNYIPGRSVLFGTLASASQLLEHYAGSGTWREPNKEIIDCGHDIGIWHSADDTESRPTSRFMIHYSHTGAHIVPLKPAAD